MSRLWVVLLFGACGGKTAAPTSPPPPAPPPSDDGIGRTCGTRGVADCPANMFCDYAPGASCGEADAPGHCAVRPQTCAQTSRPVCGCDGKTYSDPCAAAAAAIGIRDDGPCP